MDLSYTPEQDTFRREAGGQFDPDLAHMVADGLERDGKRFFCSAPDLLF